MHYALCDYVLDIGQNAVEAGAGMVRIAFDETADETRASVEDNGCGMSGEQVQRALDPFFTDGTKHVKRHVGLGLPFLKQATEQAGGAFSIESEKGKGTRVAFSFPKDNVDSPPMGEIPELFLSLLCLPGDYEMVIRRTRSGGIESGAVEPRGQKPPVLKALSYELSRKELAEAVGGLERVDSLTMLREYLVSQEED